MAPLFLLLATLAVVSPVSAAGESIIAISQSGIMHLDWTGVLLGWRPETFQWWQGWHVAANPRNGTVCWVSAPEDQGKEGVMRCAPIANLNQTWDLPQPRLLRVNKADAIAFDWVNENWYITVSRGNYICSYMFDKCTQVGESGGNVRYFAAYDIPNRLLFRIVTDGAGPYRLESVRLDGSDVRVLPTSLTYPTGLAVDPVRRQVYILDQVTGFEEGVFRADYDGQNKRRVSTVEDEEFTEWRKSISVVDGHAVMAWRNHRVITSISPGTEEVTDLVQGSVKGETIPALAEVRGLLAVAIVSQKTQPEVEDRCVVANCSDLWIPVVVNGSAEATCICPPGEELVDLGCHKTHPIYLLVTGSGSLQVVDLQTEKVATLLPYDVMHLDFFWEGGDEFTLLWIVDGSLYSMSWSPNAPEKVVKTIVNGSETVKVLDVAVDWNQRHIIWIEDDPSKSKFDDPVRVMMAPLDSAYVRTVLTDIRHDPTCLFVLPPGRAFSYIENRWGEMKFKDPLMGDGSSSYLMYSARELLTTQPEDIVVDAFLGEERWPDRYVWLDRNNQSVEYLRSEYKFLNTRRYQQLTHPSLAEAGGLDVLKSRLFWTDRSSGRLWTADTETGEEPHELPITAGTGPIRVLHPWNQPRAEDQLCDENRNGCSHFCLRAVVRFEEKAACACPDGMQLGDDEKTCQ